MSAQAQEKKPSEYEKGCVAGVTMVLLQAGYPVEAINFGKIAAACKELKEKPEQAARRVKKQWQAKQRAEAAKEQYRQTLLRTKWI